MPPFSFLRKSDAAAGYNPVDADDYAGLEHDGLDLEPAGNDNSNTNVSQHRRRNTRGSRANSRLSILSSNWSEIGYPPPASTDPHRVSSRDATPISHPTPGLQTVKGAYVGNISRLEDSAEKMSLGMDIEAELQKLRDEQRQTEGSRRSSLQNSIQNSRPASQAASGPLRLDELPSPSAYIPLATESPFATSPVRSRHASLTKSVGSRPLSPTIDKAGPTPQSPQQAKAPSRRSSAYGLQSPPLALQTVFEDGGGQAGPKEMAREQSKASHAYSESMYSPEGGQRMKRDDSQAYSESMYSGKSPVDQALKPLPLDSARGQPGRPSWQVSKAKPIRTAYSQALSPSHDAPELAHGQAFSPTHDAPGNVAQQALSPSHDAPELVTYQAYTPGAIQVVHDQTKSNPNGSYANAAPKRRGSAGSMNTFQQAERAFRDFDGAHGEYHYADTDDEEGDPLQRPDKSHRESSMTIRKVDNSGREMFLLSPDASGSDKRVSLMPSTPSPDPDAQKRKSVMSLSPDADKRRKSTMAFGPVRPQTPPEGQIFYPAPIPAMLSLPSKLSKGPSAAQLQQRKGQIIADARASVLRPGMFEPGGFDGPAVPPAELDPHLKASLYFDHKPLNYELKLIEGSATKTLDAILDAASKAPIGAFTDHPYAGVLGPEVYGPPEPPQKPGNAGKRSSSGTLLASHNRRSSQPLNRRSTSGSALFLGHSEEDAARASSEGTPLTHPDGHHDEGDGYFEGEEPIEDDRPDANNFQGEHPDYIPVDTARPSTLLAELQLRKAENKNRTRAGGSAFPNGMHASLLQLDAVAQHQAKSRRGRQVRLAWEDPELLAAEDEDEDVPLGMLLPNAKRPEHSLLPAVPQARSPSFADGQSLIDIDEPAEEPEKEETLGERKARLALEAEKKKFTLQVDGIEGDDSKKVEDEDDDVPLAVRKSRLHKRNDSEFTSELMSQLGALSVEEEEQRQSEIDASPGKKARPARMKNTQSLSSMSALAPPKQPQGEETLGQRRRRLQAQQAASEDAKRLQEQVRLRNNSSMDLLAGEPGPALIGQQADAAMPNMNMHMNMMLTNNSNPGFQPVHSPGAVQSPFGGPGMFPHMQMPMQTAPGFMPGVMPATSFGFAAPPMSLPMAQQMQSSNPGQPAQPLGLLGAHVMQQQQMQHGLPAHTARGMQRQSSMPMQMPQTGKQGKSQQQPMTYQQQMQLQMQMQMQDMNPARKDMVDRWRQGVAS